MREYTSHERALEKVLFEGLRTQRFLLDTPITREVWRRYLAADDERSDLLLTPEKHVDPVVLARELRDRLKEVAPSAPGKARLAYTTTFVVASLTFGELVSIALPLSQWWRDRIADKQAAGRKESGQDERVWLNAVVETVQSQRRAAEPLVRPDWKPKYADQPLLALVTLNRPVQTAVTASRRTVKADAATGLFGLDTEDIRWAVIDTGIDARHIGFRRANATGGRYKTPFPAGENRTRVLATYDFSLLRDAQTAAFTGSKPKDPRVRRIVAEHGSALQDLGKDMSSERPLDWKLVAPMLEIPHGKGYEPPSHDHGTHVAGILAADWESDEGLRQGICPELELYDLRIFDQEGRGDEFAVTAALQFVDYLNGFGRKIVVQGANVSLSLDFNFAAFACGQTPVCREANRLANGGVVVVAAAGNQGVSDYSHGDTSGEGYRSVSLTDPGNADGVITVGATHRTNPHAYGVSFFSSRGPTGDGRSKPDLVAPGEKIEGPLRDDGWGEMDGTSQAAAHVSGAAALLLARHRELIGNPDRVKQVLCGAATDLARERHFQGAGLVDALRAIEAV